MGKTMKPLPEPAIYLPFDSGRYDVKPNLFRLGHDFGNQARDKQVLQFDLQADQYRHEKLRARKHDLQQYYCDILSTTGSAGNEVHRVLIAVLCKEYPGLFQTEFDDNDRLLHCRQSGETLVFDRDYGFKAATSSTGLSWPEYTSGLDALLCQIQEDLCVLRAKGKSGRLVAAHLCFPNRWAPAEKIGKSFLDIHQPVAGFARVNRNTDGIVRAMLGGSAFVRFAWGLSNDARLDHHPLHAGDFSFESDSDPVFVRVERQVVVGLPKAGLILFFIRTYYHDCHQLRGNNAVTEKLANALSSMDDGILEYKQLLQSRDRLVEWLREGC